MLQLKQGDDSGSASQFTGANVLTSANPTQPLIDAAGNLKNLLDPTIQINQFAFDFARSLGEGDEFAQLLSQHLANSSLEITKLAEGADGTALANQYMSEYMDEFGRSTVISQQSMMNLLLNSKVLGVESKSLISNFASIGKEISSVSEYTKIMAIQAKNFSVPLSQIADDVIPKLDKMNQFGFNKGIEGLVKMSIQSRRLKLDMEETFNLADDLFSPEKAFETAAFFQRMGVVSSELTDAFALQDIARNRVDDLQTAIADMASTFLEFDEETQQFKVPASSVDDLIKISEETGISYQNLVRSGGELLKMQSRTKQLGELGLDYSESQIQQLEGMMELLPSKEGGLSYQVTFTTADGQTVTEEISKLTDKQRIQLEQFLITGQEINQGNQEYVAGQFEATKSFSSIFKETKATNEAALSNAIAATGGSDIVAASLEVYKATSSAFIENFSLTNQDFRTFLNGFNANLQGVVKSLASADFTGALTKLSDSATSLAAFAGVTGLDTINDAFTNLGTSIAGFTGIDISGFKEEIDFAKTALENFKNAINVTIGSLPTPPESPPPAVNTELRSQNENNRNVNVIVNSPPQLSLPEIDIASINNGVQNQNNNNTNVSGKVELVFKTDGSLTTKQVDEITAQLTKSGNAQKIGLAIEKAFDTRTSA